MDLESACPKNVPFEITMNLVQQSLVPLSLRSVVNERINHKMEHSPLRKKNYTDTCQEVRRVNRISERYKFTQAAQ